MVFISVFLERVTFKQQQKKVECDSLEDIFKSEDSCKGSFYCSLMLTLANINIM